MYGGVHPLPAVVGVKLGMCTPHGRKPATKRCRDSQATAASARGSRDSRYGKPMATPAPPRNFRLLNLDFIAVVSLVVAIRARLAFAGRSLCGSSGRLVRNASLDDDHGNPRFPVAGSGSHRALRYRLGVRHRVIRVEQPAGAEGEKVLGYAGGIAGILRNQLGEIRAAAEGRTGSRVHPVCVDRGAVVHGAVCTDGVEVLEADTQRIEQVVASGAPCIRAMRLELCSRGDTGGCGSSEGRIRIGRGRGSWLSTRCARVSTCHAGPGP